MTFRAVLVLGGELVPVSADLSVLDGAKIGPTRSADRDEITAVQHTGPASLGDRPSRRSGKPAPGEQEK